MHFIFCRTTARTEETANLLEHADSSDQEEIDSGPSTRNPAAGEGGEPELEASIGASRDPTQLQSDRIRSRYISHLLPATNIPERP